MLPGLTSTSSRLAALVTCLHVLGCQGTDLTLPADGAPSSVRAWSGSNQEGIVGTQLPEPLVVQVTDAAARPVQGVSLHFLSDVPGVEIEPPDPATDDSGQAEVRVRLGTVEGIQTVEARLVGDAALGTSFRLSAVAGDQRDDAPDEDGKGGHGGKGGGRGRDHGGDHGPHDHEDHDDD